MYNALGFFLEYLGQSFLFVFLLIWLAHTPHFTKRGFYRLYYINKTEHFCYKYGHAMLAVKQDWPRVLQEELQL